MSNAGLADWALFGLIVSSLLAIDLAQGSRSAASRPVRDAWNSTLTWIAAALLFGGWVTFRMGREAGIAYMTAYLLEESLSVDNLAVFAIVFLKTGIPAGLQRRVLSWGVIGALVMRALLVATGLVLLARFPWIAYGFGALLVFSAIRLLTGNKARKSQVGTICELCSSGISRLIPIVTEFQGGRFTLKRDGKRYATPLLVALVVNEAADVVFALDSVPAVIAVTADPFLVYASNIFALLGLRSLYGVIADVISNSIRIRAGLAVLLAFTAVKLLLRDVIAISVTTSLLVVVMIVVASVIAEAWNRRLLRETQAASADTNSSARAK
jgi:tellurite resistance protein TerC